MRHIEVKVDITGCNKRLFLSLSSCILCFLGHCDVMALPLLPRDIPVPPAVLARRGAVCFTRRPAKKRRLMQVRMLSCCKVEMKPLPLRAAREIVEAQY
jgi:hypothetical protein